MKLSDLSAEFVGRTERTAGGRLQYRHEVPFAEAQGIFFICPRCPDGHSILVWFTDRGVPDEMPPKARWTAKGAGLDDLTVRPSILIGQPCGLHCFITKGEVEPA